jgi:hypothetical protein
MLQSRRGFLIGAGSVLTAAFVGDAKSFVLRNSRPLLASPTEIAQHLHWCHNDYDGTYHLSLGPWTMKPLPVPTWCEFFVSEGIAHQTETDAEKSGRITSLDRRTTPKPCPGATGRISSTPRTVRVPGRTTCSVGSTSGLTRNPLADHYSNSTRVMCIPATTAFGLMPRINSRFRLFWSRVDYMLTRRADWVTCDEGAAELEKSNTNTASALGGLCGPTGDGRNAPAPEPLPPVAAQNRPVIAAKRK